MKKHLFVDPLSQPVEYYLDSLDGLSKELKNWLGELGAGRKISDREFHALKSLADSQGSVFRLTEKQKLFFLFGDSMALRCFDAEKIRQERLKLIPGLFFQENGTFYHYVAQILPAIKAYAKSDAEFREKYETAVINAGKNIPVSKRMITYLHSRSLYPLELIAELEGMDASMLAPELLGFLYWGKDVYRAMYLLETNDKSETVYRNIPKWRCGDHSYIPFIAYAVLSQDMDIVDAVFEGADPITVARSLACLFNHYNDEYRFYKNWLDKAIIQDFFQESLAEYHECNGIALIPCGEGSAVLFSEYLARVIERDKSDTALAGIQVFFPCIAPEENRGISGYLSYMENAEIAQNAYWRLIKAIAERSAAYPVGDLLQLERFKNYGRGDIDKTGFYILEMYLNRINPLRDDIILLGRYICTVIENRAVGTPESLPWLLMRTRFASFCSEHLDNPDFLGDLLSAPEICDTVKYDWINYVVTIWLLHNYRDRKPKPVWPLAATETEKLFFIGDENNPIRTVRALLLSEGEIRAENILLEYIWDFLSGEAKDFVIDRDFIPCQYFFRANKNAERDETLFRKMLFSCADELKIMYRLKFDKKFDFFDFLLRLEDVSMIKTISPEAFKYYGTTADEAVLRYLECHGDSVEKVKHIASYYKGL